MSRARKQLANARGFTLIEMAVALVVFAVVGLAIFSVMVHTTHSEEMGSSIAEAQQNARAALDTILRDLRESGYGTGTMAQVPVETASQYRVTFVLDQNEDGVIGPGERITYFLDNDAGDPIVANTPNPDDYVLRRVVSTAGNPNAAPSSGVGQVVAYAVTQRTPEHSGWDIPLFDYFNQAGQSIVGAADDPAGSSYGKTVPDSLLGKPMGTGLQNAIKTVRVDVVAEATHKDPETHGYRQVRVTGTIHPRNFGLSARKLFADFVGTGTGSGTGTGTATGTGADTTGTGADSSAVQLPPEEPPIRINTERVLAMILQDFNEEDSKEGSNVITDHQHDLDILIGAKSSANRNRATWFEGLPDKYPAETLYPADPNYTGFSSQAINFLAAGKLDTDRGGAETYVDVVAAAQVSDTQGGFEVWINQGGTGGKGGYLGSGSSPSAYYSNSSGKGQGIAVGDFDMDGDLDVVLGTRTGAIAGAYEIWTNDGDGNFTFSARLSATGEVNAVTVADFNNDGYPDFVGGTKTAVNNNVGEIELWLNKRNGTFGKVRDWDAGGQVKCLAAGDMDRDGDMDVVTGLRTGNRRGQVSLWLNNGAGTLTMVDYATADDEVLSLALGKIDYASESLDIVAGNAGSSVQAWFCDADASDPSQIIPANESWADANAGGLVNAVAIGKVEQGKDTSDLDLLNDIVIGTAVTDVTGEIVVYLNPYVWTLNP